MVKLLQFLTMRSIFAPDFKNFSRLKTFLTAFLSAFATSDSIISLLPR